MQNQTSSESSYDPRFPVGRFLRKPSDPIAKEELDAAISTLAYLPEELRNALRGLDEAQLDTPYREGGWKVRQLTHHMADSHMNAFIRMRLALTTDKPTILPYDQDAWAQLHDSREAPVEWSLEMLESLHARWVLLLELLDPVQFERTFVHPEQGERTLAYVTLLYAWHSQHHLAHITHLRAQKGW